MGLWSKYLISSPLKIYQLFGWKTFRRNLDDCLEAKRINYDGKLSCFPSHFSSPLAQSFRWFRSKYFHASRMIVLVGFFSWRSFPSLLITEREWKHSQPHRQLFFSATHTREGRRENSCWKISFLSLCSPPTARITSLHKLSIDGPNSSSWMNVLARSPHARFDPYFISPSAFRSSLNPKKC